MVSAVDEKNTYYIYNNIYYVYNNVLTKCAGRYVFSYYSYTLFYYFRKYKRTPRIPRHKYNRRLISAAAATTTTTWTIYVTHAEEKIVIINNIIYYITHTTRELTCTKETPHTHTNTGVLSTGEKNLVPSTCGMLARHWWLENQRGSRYDGRRGYHYYY